MAGLTVGMPLGIYVFAQFDQSQMRIAIGGVLLLAVVVVGSTAGLLAGILGGAVGSPGHR